MSKELFVSSTPHETKLALVEDDQVAELYFERENEYSLAGSIYKGRVTRVLPGMQSAFVDVGLERDAFLYVSDFLEVPDEHGELEDVTPVAESRIQTFEPALEPQGGPAEEPPAAFTPPAAGREPRADEPEEGGGRWRGRRRRRGRRGRIESKYSTEEGSRSEPVEPRPAEPPAREARRPEPRYQPIVLPGESISKYRDLAPAEAAPAPQPAASVWPENGQAAEASEVFTTLERPALHTALVGEEPAAVQEEHAAAAAESHELESASAGDGFRFSPGAGAIEEEEIEEEEGEFALPHESLEEDVVEEMEEEVREGMIEAGRQVMEAVEEAAIQATALEGYEDDLDDDLEDAEGLEVEEFAAAAEEEGGEGEEGEGEEEARAELRAPASTAGLQQRAPRRGFERGRGRRAGGRRMGRGRREMHRPQATISELLKEGQEILVQIAKEPIGKKGARITSHIALPGRFLVYMPTVNHMGVSRKIASDEERQRLKRIIMSERNGGHGGFIVRTAAEGADEGELRADIRFLKNLWHEIRTRAESGNSPALIYHDLNLVERILRDQVNQNFSRIWVDTEQEYERIVRFLSRFQPGLVNRVKLYTKETPLFEEFGVQEEIDKALKSKVWLKSGGYIVINQTEALVAIDINTGKYVGKTQRLEDTIVKTNIDAIKEIVRQVRLRDLGGIIVIDFIDMDERRNRQKVMAALEEALRSDRAPSKVLQFNDFGLVAITRKRVKQSLERTLGEPCSYCTGTGLVKSVNTVCNEIYVEMRKLSKQLAFKSGDVLLRVHPEVAKQLKANNARWLQELEELTQRNLIVKSDPMLHQEQFDIN